MARKLDLQQYDTIDEVRRWIKGCEGWHVQQVSYSTYHDALTQVCFSCRVVRTNMTIQPVPIEHPKIVGTI